MRLESARRLAVARQHLSGSRPTPVTADDIQALVRDIGCLQLDPTAVVARNHLLVLFSRLGPFDRALVDALLWDQRRLYEFWAHMASIVPADDRALHASLPPRWGDTDNRTESWLTRRAGAVDQVLARLADVDTVHAADFEEHAKKYQSGWGTRSEISDTLSLLWLRGQIVPAGRNARGRRWALADRWFGAPLGPFPEPPAAVRTAATRSLRSLGIATRSQVNRHFLRTRYPGLETIWKGLHADGLIVPVDLGIKGEWFVHAEDLDLLERIDGGDFEPRTTFLSPFDNLVCDRHRTVALWDFDFRLEIYVPKSTRWGYFVMPLLHGGRLIARFDLAVDRGTGRLVVVGERWQPGWDGRRRPMRAVQRALGELATFAGAAPPSTRTP